MLFTIFLLNEILLIDAPVQIQKHLNASLAAMAFNKKSLS